VADGRRESWARPTLGACPVRRMSGAAVTVRATAPPGRGRAPVYPAAVPSEPTACAILLPPLRPIPRHTDAHMPTLQRSIVCLAEELLRCNDRCAGIWLDRDAGIVPRSLFLERATAKGRGCFAVGLNPGSAPLRERRFYCESGVTIANVNAFRESIGDIPYLARSRSVINQLGLTGPILWSNLAKCQNEKDRKGLPPIQTLRHCVRRFLVREMAKIPPCWAVLGIGWEAYRALAYLVPERIVIGIPHPTGGFRDYRKLMDKGVLREHIKERALKALHTPEPSAVWLGAAKPGA
jgi:hypothetical protein